MPPCPKCRQEVHRRKGDACPHCGQALHLHKGHFYRAEEGSPNLAITTEFEKLVGQQLSKAQGRTIPFRFNRKSPQYTLELVTAESLLAECDYDLDLVRRALHELFNNQAWSWKTRSSLTHIRKDFPGALAIARVAAEIAQADLLRQQQLAQQLDNKENVFG